MAIHITNDKADALTRKFAEIANVRITDAIIIAMSEAIERRVGMKTPIQTAARLREKYGITLCERARRPLAREILDKMWESE